MLIIIVKPYPLVYNDHVQIQIKKAKNETTISKTKQMMQLIW